MIEWELYDVRLAPEKPGRYPMYTGIGGDDLVDLLQELEDSYPYFGEYLIRANGPELTVYVNNTHGHVIYSDGSGGGGAPFNDGNTPISEAQRTFLLEGQLQTFREHSIIPKHDVFEIVRRFGIDASIPLDIGIWRFSPKY